MKAQLIVIAIGSFAGIAGAGYTQTGRVPVAEHNQEQILERTYGGDFVRFGNDYSNGSVIARRLNDSAEIGGNDESWTLGRFSTRTVARFSNNAQSLCVSDGRGTFDLFDAGGFGYDVSGAANFDAGGAPIRFERHGDSGVHSSQAPANADGRDHMISFEVLGNSGVNEKVWLMFWEDLNVSRELPAGRTHSDFNDLAVEVRSAAVPLPTATWAGVATLGMIGVFRKRIRRSIGV